MNDKVAPAFMLGLAVGMLLAICLIAFVFETPAEFRREAVKAGKAEYYLDENFQRQWRWKPNTETTVQAPVLIQQAPQPEKAKQP